jgi:hypothetical protein
MTKELVTQLFGRETDRVLESIPGQIEKKSGECAERGIGRSGMYVRAVNDIVVAGLRELVSQRVRIEKEVWERQAKKPTKRDAEVCKGAISSAIEHVAPRLFAFIEEASRSLGSRHLITSQSEEFGAARAKFIREAHREIDIWIGFAEIEAERPLVPPVYITYNLENYGIFQSGEQSRAVFMGGGTQENQWILEGLSQVKSEIAELKELGAQQKSELIGAVETAITEVKKGKPNLLTIGGIITAVGSATSVLANATKAYETVKSIAGKFGVTLP